MRSPNARQASDSSDASGGEASDPVGFLDEDIAFGSLFGLQFNRSAGGVPPDSESCQSAPSNPASYLNFFSRSVSVWRWWLDDKVSVGSGSGHRGDQGTGPNGEVSDLTDSNFYPSQSHLSEEGDQSTVEF